MVQPQPSSPTVVIAYGHPGLEWLIGLHRSLGLGDYAPFPGALLQLWVVDVDPDEVPARVDALKVVDSDEAIQSVRQRLDLGRVAEIQEAFPDFRVDHVLVLERWSPFQVPGDARAGLHDRLDRCRRVGFEPGAAREFRYEWIGLCDLARAPGPLTTAEHEEVTRHFGSGMLPDSNLVVDQADAGGAVLSPHVADRVLRTVGRVVIRTHLNGQDISSVLGWDRTLEGPATAFVHGLSTTRYRHGDRTLAVVSVRKLRERLFHGRIEASALSFQDGLAEAVRAELRQTSPVHRLATVERFDLVARCLAGGTARLMTGSADPWEELDRTGREELRTRPTPDDLGSVAGSRVGGGQGWFRRVLDFLRRLLGLGHAEPGRPDSAGRAPAAANGPRADWTSLLAAAGKLRDAWDQWRIKGLDPGGEFPVWSRDQGAYRLTALPGSSSDGPDLTLEDLKLLTRRSLQRMAGLGDLSGTALIDEIIEGVATEIVLGDHGAVRHIRDAIGVIGTEAGSARWPQFSVRTGHQPRGHLVVWFSGEGLVEEERLSEIEVRTGAGRSADVKLLPILQQDETVRVGISEAIPWGELLSLRPSAE